MPSPAQILAGLEQIVNNWRWLAIAWHACFALLLVVTALDLRPAQRLAGILLALPLLSAAAAAWATANVFNGLLLTLSSLALLVIAVRLPVGRIRVAPLWAVIVGAALFILGWLYPHFLATQSLVPYLCAAPTGTVPCPTLSIHRSPAAARQKHAPVGLFHFGQPPPHGPPSFSTRNKPSPINPNRAFGR